MSKQLVTHARFKPQTKNFKPKKANKVQDINILNISDINILNVSSAKHNSNSSTSLNTVGQDY
jgi:hypothetical protein